MPNIKSAKKRVKVIKKKTLQSDPDGDWNALSWLPVCTDGIFGRGCNGPWNRCRSARREDQCCKESDAGLILKFKEKYRIRKTAAEIISEVTKDLLFLISVAVFVM